MRGADAVEAGAIPSHAAESPSGPEATAIPPQGPTRPAPTTPTRSTPESATLPRPAAPTSPPPGIPEGASMSKPHPAGPSHPEGEPVRRVLAVIPARGGSKGVPAKNLAPVGGVPLVARAIRACVASPLVTDVVVSTDDTVIAETARAAGAEVVLRPAAIAGDTATSEAAVLHAMDGYEQRHGVTVDVVLLVQCTSPFIVREDVDGVVGAITRGGADTAHTVAPFHGFVWRDASDEPPAIEGERTAAEGGTTTVVTDTTTSGGYGVNHDKSFRPRRQDRPQDLLETGAVYGMAATGFRTHKHRFFGHTELVRTDPARVLEIDDPHDLARARALAPLFDADRDGALPTRDDIDAVVLDFDGTQTDDRVLIDSDGREFVTVHRGDGLGIAALRRSGLTMLILSTEQNPVVAARGRKLKIPVLHGIDRKDLALKQWCEEQGIAPERVLYVGNDVNDLPCFGLVGWPVAVASAHDVVRGAARAVTSVPGGDGAIREIAAWILGPSLNS